VDYSYWTLCKTVRTARGPRQQVIASLGKLDPDEIEAGWDEMEALLEGRPPPPRQMQLGEVAGAKTAARWELVDLQKLRVERTREFGEVYLALALWRRLGLHRLLDTLIQPGRETVVWSQVISLLVAARFCAQRSELGIAEGWFERTALEDLLGVKPEQINDDRLYRALDVLGAHKEALCAHLMERYRDWFGVRFEFLLYDVTSTFFEGQALGNPLAARGYSRDQRPDRKQVCIGLVCTPEGLPLSYEIFAGNRTDVTTVEEVVGIMEGKYGQAERVWVMDRGMVSEGNIAFLRARKARYIAGTPKSQLRHYELQLLENEGWQEVQEGLEARLVSHPDGAGDEHYVLCRSQDRQNKERAMLERQTCGLQEQLELIDQRLARYPQRDVEKVGRRIGRWQGKYPAAARILQVEVRRDKAGQACGLRMWSDLEKGRQAHRAQGAYLLRTNCTERDPAQLWRWYIQLTQAEAAFRTAKSDLSLRPIFHQKARRVKAHILVCFLALALWRTLEMWMSAKGLGTCARKLIAEIATIHSMDVILPVRRGETVTELRIRTVARPEPRVAQLLAHLGLDLPTRNKVIENVV
jgi:transposase